MSAGLPGRIKDLCRKVCDTCRNCRPWKRPGPANVVSTTQHTSFNEAVEFDLLFWKDAIVLHLIDCAIRWSECCLIPNRCTATILEAIDKEWCSRWTPPKCIVSDGETGINCHEGRLWAERKQIELKIKPTGGIGAGTVERHHELIRQALHKIEDQCALEGIPLSKQQCLSEAVMVHNSLLNVQVSQPSTKL